MKETRIDILTTGGTIASRSNGPMASGTELALDVQGFFPGVLIAVREICRIGSSQITSDILWSIGVEVGRSFRSGATGVVVTHGTDTLEETAYFLDLTASSLGPIAVTGAMRGFDAIAPEGLANLVESCRTVLEPGAGDYGTLVVMNDKIHLARDAAKVHSWQLDAFSSPATGPIGFAGSQGVTFVAGTRERSHAPYSALVTPVDLIKTCIDSGDRQIRAALDSGAKGLVIESLGHGHFPPDVSAAVSVAAKQKIPVVVTTRCLEGGAPNPGTVDDVGFITTDLSGPKARIKLMLALSVATDLARLAKLFALNP